MILIAELATAHGGDVGLAEAMIHAAAEAGATHVKTQHYSLSRLNPHDPQGEWLTRSRLSEADQRRLGRAAYDAKMWFVSTPFDEPALEDLRSIGVINIKVASSESHRVWWEPQSHERWFVSYPWGRISGKLEAADYALTAIPLYPTPPECVAAAELLDGWSDHCEGLMACYRAIARGAKVIEVHVHHANSRQMPWDKSMDDLRRLRDFWAECEPMNVGVSRKFLDRWSA